MFLIRITLNWIAFTTSVYLHPGSSAPSLTDTSRAPTKASRTTSREREFSQGTVCLEQNREIPGVGGRVAGGYWWWKYDEVNRTRELDKLLFWEFLFSTDASVKMFKRRLIKFGIVIGSYVGMISFVFWKFPSPLYYEYIKGSHSRAWLQK